MQGRCGHVRRGSQGAVGHQLEHQRRLPADRLGGAHQLHDVGVAGVAGTSAIGGGQGNNVAGIAGRQLSSTIRCLCRAV